MATASRKCTAGAIDAAGFIEAKDWLLDEWGSLLWVGLVPEVVERAPIVSPICGTLVTGPLALIFATVRVTKPAADAVSV